MKLISHRGNVDGKYPQYENLPEYVDKALDLGYDVEVDVWYISESLFLGHDKAEYAVTLDWLLDRSENLWIHCKNLNALNFLSLVDISFNYFWHQNDDYTLTSKGFIWAYPGKKLSKQSICVMPEWNNPEFKEPTEFKDVFGVCTDYPIKISQHLKNL